MSMLSAQVDKLRKVADLYDGTTQPPIAKELQRPALAQELRDAADTILSLRDRAQELQAENAKLRGLLQRLHKEYQYMRVRPRQMYLQHEQRMRSIEDEMRELEIEV